MDMRTVAALLFLIQSTDFSAEGLKALEERRYEAAVQSFIKAIEADASDYSAHFNLALAYGFLNKDAEGIAEYANGSHSFRVECNGTHLDIREDALKQKGERR